MAEQTDEDLAMEFLGSRFEHHGDKVSIKNLLPGSAREKECQTALVRLLRGAPPISTMIRWRIAALFDPEHTQESRKLVIALRHKGKQPNHPRDLMIASDIAAELATGRDMESSVAEVKQRYGVSRAQVLRAWKKNKTSPLAKDPRSLN